MPNRFAPSRVLRFTTAAIVFAAVVLFPPHVSADSWNDELAVALDKAAANYYNPDLLIVLGTFTYAHEDLSSPFSRWLADELHGLIPRTKSLRLFDKEAAAAMDPALRQTYAALFASAKVDAILYGRFFEVAGGLRVQFELTGLSDGALIGAGEVFVPRSALPAGLGIRPGEGTVAAKAALALIGAPAAPVPATQAAPVAATQTADVAALRVSVSTDRGAGAVYAAGERLHVLVAVNKRAWVKVYHIDVRGRVQLIWPNRFSGAGGPLEAGKVIQIPGDGDPFDFVLGPPFGTEFIKVVASTEAFAATEGDFADLQGGTARDSIARGMTPAAGGGERAEGLASYLILEKP